MLCLTELNKNNKKYYNNIIYGKRNNIKKNKK